VPRLFDQPTRFLFFTGKGGVGKTSVASAAAIALADRGRRVLLVSTDPASNLDEVLGVALSGRPTPVPEVTGLFAMNIDPVQAAVAYRERVVGPYRGVLPAVAVASIEEQLSGACTVEIAAFDEFSKLLGEPSATAAFDHVIFDTAPTGHTLRLLELPAAWSTFLDASAGGTSCLGPLSGLAASRALYAASHAALRSPTATTTVLVARPERSALKEAERTRVELGELGVRHLVVVINGLFRAADPRDPVAGALERRGLAALAALPPGLAALPRLDVPLLPFGLVGIPALRAMFDRDRLVVGGAVAVDGPLPPIETGSFDALVDRIARAGHGVVMTMGKGGVGKTTIAARIAAAIARRGFRVVLTTTDPAAHVEDAARDRPPSMSVTRIDPVRATARYTAEVLAMAAPTLDAAGRRLLEEDLRSPCTEEIAVFRELAETVAQGDDRFVVIDTAPTGHTILLLDAAEAYHREVARKPSGSPAAVRMLLPRLRDRDFTHVVLVTLPEATPIHEAMQLERDLVRAGIVPDAWIVNQSLSPLHVTDPVLRARQIAETSHLRELARHVGHTVIVPWSESPGA
jgi:arsenite/tail-anchored protein-transporting ATPase